ncbi:alpha/beta hydrolase [Streptomyces bambusae]|uniref:Alpha/beta hydrolase fold domain-containing protein n=1 Tax=Streptomyces bambusae TaxID=1550616 RepID=A0ABS6Z7R6_9ACTN|nr:alpha/beta hydrolase [Streptomyces bambusae]MBW5483805.1 alpha/beta hydrolase fold domain-containing protein [Streptomyces bambusae]
MSGTTDRLDPRARPFVRAFSAVFPDVGGAVSDAVQARRIMAASPPPPGEPPAVGAVADRTVPGPPGAPPVPVRIYRPDPARWPGPRPTVVFSHGGGFVLCDLDTHDRIARNICRVAGAVVVSVDYRRAPEHRFPAAVEDAHAALCWAGDHVAGLGGDPGALVVAGDSAGGNLAAASLLLAAERGGPRVALQVLVCPSLTADLGGDSYRRNATGYYLTTAHVRWFWEQYLGPGGDGGHPLASPLAAGPERLAGLPPAHVVVAGCDPVADDGQVYDRLLRASGVRSSVDLYPGMFHGFLALPEYLSPAREALERLGGVIHSLVKDGKTFGGVGGTAE